MADKQSALRLNPPLQPCSFYPVSGDPLAVATNGGSVPLYNRSSELTTPSPRHEAKGRLTIDEF